MCGRWGREMVRQEGAGPWGGPAFQGRGLPGCRASCCRLRAGQLVPQESACLRTLTPLTLGKGPGRRDFVFWGHTISVTGKQPQVPHK